MDTSQTTVQELNLELIRRAGFNDFDGTKVSVDLEAHRDWWKGVIIDREGASGIDLIKLRDIADNFWNADTLFVLVKPGYEEDMKALADTWSADEVEWIENPGRKLGVWGQEVSLLRVWWG